MDGWRWTTGESQMEPEARRSMAKISAAELVQSRFIVGFGPVTRRAEEHHYRMVCSVDKCLLLILILFVLATISILKILINPYCFLYTTKISPWYPL